MTSMDLLATPGNSARLAEYMIPRITSIAPNHYRDENWIVLQSDDPHLAALGINDLSKNLTVAVRSLYNKIGNVAIHSARDDALLVFDNENWGGYMTAGLRLLGSASTCIFNLRGSETIALSNVFLRSDQQFLFWGYESSAVDCLILEIEGKGECVIIGDDALISNGVTIRNHDMHAIVDASSLQVLNKPVSTVIERHVWIGQDVMLLRCERVGYGSILGARALVRGTFPPKVIVSGMPARVVSEGRTWGRATASISDSEKDLLCALDGESLAT